MWALSSAQTGTACATCGERLVGAGGQRLLDQLDARMRRPHARNGSSMLGRPGLVGVGDEARIGPRRAHGGHALGVAGAAELQLEQLQVRHGACRRRHLRRASPRLRV